MYSSPVFDLNHVDKILWQETYRIGLFWFKWGLCPFLIHVAVSQWVVLTKHCDKPYCLQYEGSRDFSTAPCFGATKTERIPEIERGKNKTSDLLEFCKLFFSFLWYKTTPYLFTSHNLWKIIYSPAFSSTSRAEATEKVECQPLSVKKAKLHKRWVTDKLTNLGS